MEMDDKDKRIIELLKLDSRQSIREIAKKTRIIGIIVVFATITSFALNMLLIPVWSITGSAIATLLSQFIYWFACYYYSQKVFYIPYEIRKISVNNSLIIVNDCKT